MGSKSTLLLGHYLKELRLPSFLREYGKMASQCAAEIADHPEHLLRLAELELRDAGRPQEPRPQRIGAVVLPWCQQPRRPTGPELRPQRGESPRRRLRPLF